MAEDPTLISDEHQHFSYVSRGEYIRQLQRWAEHFPREQLLVLPAEHLFTQPEQTYARALDHLSLPAYGGVSFKAHNRPKAYDKIAPQTRQHLDEHYAPLNQQLREWVGEEWPW